MRFQRVLEIMDKQDRRHKVDESFSDVMGAIGGAIGSLISGLLQGLAQAVNQSSKDYQRRIHEWGGDFDRIQRQKQRELERIEADKARQGKIEHRNEVAAKKEEERKAKEAETTAHNDAIEYFVSRFNADKTDLEAFKKNMSDAYRSHIAGVVTTLEKADADIKAGTLGHPPPITPTVDDVKNELEAAVTKVAGGDAALLARMTKWKTNFTDAEINWLLSLLQSSLSGVALPPSRQAGVTEAIAAIQQMKTLGYI